MKTATVLPPDRKRKWYGLALRHLRMASRLLNSGFADGAIFHAYHAYECVVSAFIAANNYPVPPEGWTKLTSPTKKPVSHYPSPKGGIEVNSAHKARLLFFKELADPTKRYYTRYTILSRSIRLSDRMDSLHYHAKLDRLPHEAYNHSFADSIIHEVLSFAHEVWKEIR